MKLVLIGFMGSGKTTVAELLSKSLRIPLIEMDDRILKQSGKATIADIFNDEGEEAFRALETSVACSLKGDSACVISTGGGSVTRAETMSALSESATVFFLDTSFTSVTSRITDVSSRPLFRSKRDAFSLFEKRRPLYLQYAHHVIATDTLTPEQVANEIVEKIVDLKK